jgi:hypothetical protein
LVGWLVVLFELGLLASLYRLYNEMFWNLIIWQFPICSCFRGIFAQSNQSILDQAYGEDVLDPRLGAVEAQ